MTTFVELSELIGKTFDKVEYTFNHTIKFYNGHTEIYELGHHCHNTDHVCITNISGGDTYDLEYSKILEVTKASGVELGFPGDKTIYVQIMTDELVICFDFIGEENGESFDVILVKGEKMKDYAKIEEMVGKTFTKVEKVNQSIRFISKSKGCYEFLHEQDCCEYVFIEDICGDLSDLEGTPLLVTEERSSNLYHGKKAYWTFYRFGTIKGSVTIRWMGEQPSWYSLKVKLIRY